MGNVGMNVLELIARTTAHGVTYGQVGRSTLVASAQDVEWMMVGLPEFQEHLIRAAYQQDKKARNRAWAIWFIRLMDKGWQAEKGMIRTMADTTLDYWLSPKRCSVCHGVGELMADTKVVTCEFCQGTGRHERSPSRICRSLGLPKGHVYPKWVSRWNESIGELDREEGAAALHMLNRKR